MIWHLFILAASALQYLAIVYFYVIRSPLFKWFFVIFLYNRKKLYGDSQDEDEQIPTNHSCTKKSHSRWRTRNWTENSSVRQLASQFSCSKDTVQRALLDLTYQHFLYAKPQSGYYVLEQEPNRHEDLPLKLEKDRNQAFEDFPDLYQ